jgi:hypothetical protein
MPGQQGHYFGHEFLSVHVRGLDVADESGIEAGGRRWRSSSPTAALSSARL